MYNKEIQDWIQDFHHEEQKTEARFGHFMVILRFFGMWLYKLFSMKITMESSGRSQAIKYLKAREVKIHWSLIIIDSLVREILFLSIPPITSLLTHWLRNYRETKTPSGVMRWERRSRRETARNNYRTPTECKYLLKTHSRCKIWVAGPLGPSLHSPWER